MGLNFRNRVGIGSTVCAAVLLVGLGLTIPVSGKDVVPDDQQAMLSVQGQGVTPYAQISLSTGPQQTISTKADKNGQFLFSNLKYASFTDLKFALDIPPFQKGLAQNYPSNHLEFQYEAKESIARISGQIGQYGSLALNLVGSDQGTMRFAGTEGYVASQTRTALPMSSGKSALTASIINAGEVCCPKMIVPAAPITLTILSQPIASAPPVSVPQNKDVSAPAVIRPTTIPQPVPKDTPVPLVNDKNEMAPKNANPYILLPNRDKNNQQEEKKPKVKIPYIVQGRVEFHPTSIVADEVIAATSFPSSSYDSTYVGGLKKIVDSDRNSQLMRASVMGAFLDVRDTLDTLRSLQMSTVRTLRNYTTSDAVCRFGTLTRSVALADDTAKKNQLAFSKYLMDRGTQKSGTIYGDPGLGVVAAVNNFKGKYCSVVDNNNFLEGYCKAATATPDLLYNRDVDFTRVFDVPLTLDADFSDSAVTNDKQSVMALFDNLSKIPTIMGSGSNAFDPRSNSGATQDIRSLQAMKTVTANSFAALVGEKSKSSAQASSYMKEMIQQLGLNATEAQKLLGANPSYFAQMEVLTKKLFQNPAFYANLYDSEANIDRQRVAMKAIELQQDRDFLESLRRREMLLSVLLNAKLRSAANDSDESGYVTQKQ
jgi:hypothetical protein